MEKILEFLEFFIKWFDEIIVAIQKRYHEARDDHNLIPTEEVTD